MANFFHWPTGLRTGGKDDGSEVTGDEPRRTIFMSDPGVGGWGLETPFLTSMEMRSMKFFIFKKWTHPRIFFGRIVGTFSNLI